MSQENVHGQETRDIGEGIARSSRSESDHPLALASSLGFHIVRFLT
jgi:hypothetical protein